MKIEFKLSNQDYLEYQLFASSKLKSTKNRIKYVKIYIPIGYLLYGIYLTYRDNDYIGFITFFSIAIFWYTLYPKYLKWRYNRHYSNHVKENYSNRINKNTYVEFLDNSIKTKDPIGSGDINSNEVIELIELKNQFLVKLSTEQSLIIPKSADFDQTKLINKIVNYGAKYVDELNWKWG